MGRYSKVPLYLICALIIGWLVLSTYPPEMEPASITLFGVERPLDYFMYDLVHKIGILLGFASALIPDKSPILKSLIMAMVVDAAYEVFDLFATNDNQTGIGLFIQNGIIIFAFTFGYIKFKFYPNEKDTIVAPDTD